MELQNVNETPAEERAPEVAPAAPTATEEKVESTTAPAEEAVKETKTETVAEPEAAEQVTIPETKDEIVDLLASLIEKPVETVKDAVARAKAAFYNIRKHELEEEKQAFLDKGNEESAFAPIADAAEERVKQLLATFKEKKAEHLARLEEAKAEALKKKEELLAGLRDIVGDTDNINRNYQRFQQLQQDFKAAGEVAAEHVTRLWKEYQQVTESFYDRLKINKDLRDYDFKKNKEAKEALIVEAKAADEEKDVVSAFRKLQSLHEQWRQIGPVAPDIREEIWQRFKDLSTSINKKYQSFFEERKEREKANEEAKTALCERIEALDFSSLTTFKEWDEMTNEIKELQTQWKQIGFASPRINNELFARFRAVCDKFFAAKAEHFKKLKNESSDNLRQKIELCEAAEALKDSTEWRKTTDKLVELQKKWREIGPVARKHSEAVWKRFISACDYFFEKKNAVAKTQRQLEQQNLDDKLAVIAEIEALAASTDNNKAGDNLKELMAKWQTIGHVPFKEKDALYEKYQAAIKKVNNAFGLRETRVKLTNFESNVGNMAGDSLSRERDRLMRNYDQKVNELRTYENNASFFNAKSKAGNSMLRDVERRIQRIKEDINVIEKKIEMVDAKIKEQRASQEG